MRLRSLALSLLFGAACAGPRTPPTTRSPAATSASSTPESTGISACLQRFCAQSLTGECTGPALRSAVNRCILERQGVAHSAVHMPVRQWDDSGFRESIVHASPLQQPFIAQPPSARAVDETLNDSQLSCAFVGGPAWCTVSMSNCELFVDDARRDPLSVTHHFPVGTCAARSRAWCFQRVPGVECFDDESMCRSMAERVPRGACSLRTAQSLAGEILRTTDVGAVMSQVWYRRRDD